MEFYLSFLRDAEAELVSAFELWRNLASRPSLIQAERPAVELVRRLHLGVEKAIKHSLASIDPYLVLRDSKTDNLIKLRKDLAALPAPSIFASRARLQTVDIKEGWARLLEVATHSVAEDRISAFSQAITQLTELRNQLQHAELHGDLESLIDVSEQVFTALPAGLSVGGQDVLNAVYQRNEQIEPHLRALVEEIDGNWLVLVEHLRDKGPIALRSNLLTSTTSKDSHVRAEFGHGFTFDRGLTLETIVEHSNATGVFVDHIDEDEIMSRYLLATLGRSLATQDTTQVPDAVPKRTLGDLLKRPEPIPVHEASRLKIPDTSAWLTVALPSFPPSRVSVTARTEDLQLEFVAGGATIGAVRGTLRALDSATAKKQPAILLSGEIVVQRETSRPSQGLLDQYQYQREFGLTLSLSASKQVE